MKKYESVCKKKNKEEKKVLPVIYENIRMYQKSFESSAHAVLTC